MIGHKPIIEIAEISDWFPETQEGAGNRVVPGLPPFRTNGRWLTHDLLDGLKPAAFHSHQWLLFVLHRSGCAQIGEISLFVLFPFNFVYFALRSPLQSSRPRWAPTFPHRTQDMGLVVFFSPRYSSLTLWFLAFKRKAKMGIR